MRPCLGLVVLSLATTVRATPDPFADWERIEPRSKSARLDVKHLALAHGTRLVALDAAGPILDDGKDVARIDGGKLHVLAAATGASRPRTFWWRGAALVAVDTSDHVLAIDTPSPASDGRAAQLGGAFYYVTDTDPKSGVDTAGRMRLVRYDLATKQTTVLVGTGHGYAGAIATDGKDIYIADREALWRYDVAAARKETLPGQFYWPEALSIHDGRLLVDIHGHGAVVTRPHDKVSIELDESLARPSDVIGWSDATALVLQTQTSLVHDTDGSLVPGDYASSADAITCWRSAHARTDPHHGVLHTLYRTAPGVHLCDVRVTGRSLAWLEYRDDDDGEYCAAADTLVTAQLVGACE